MTTLLFAHNAVLLRALSRELGKCPGVGPIITQVPERLLDPLDEPLSRRPVGFAILDCSGVHGDPLPLLEALHLRVQPRRWLLIAGVVEPQLTQHAIRLGASGCLLAPASAELVSAAVLLASAGGQCFPRERRTWRRIPSSTSAAQPTATASTALSLSVPSSTFFLPGSKSSG